MTEIFLARQPILDHEQSVAGYELLYPGRRRARRRRRRSARDRAVALNALSEIGLEHLVGQSRAWIKRHA